MSEVSVPIKNNFANVASDYEYWQTYRGDRSADGFRGPQKIKFYNNNTGGTTTVGQTYLVKTVGVANFSPQIVTASSAISGLASTDSVQIRVAVALEAVAASGWVKCAIEGYVDALVDGTTDVAIGDFLKFAPATKTTPIKDGAAETLKSFAVACEASTANSANMTRIKMTGKLFYGSVS